MSATTSSILLLSSGGCSSGYLLNGWHASWISSSLPSCKRENDDASGHSPGQDGFHCEQRLIQMIFPLSSTCNSVASVNETILIDEPSSSISVRTFICG